MPYADPPWIFKGRALYQLQLVKESEARRYTPPELPLVSLFGYTLGGFYLARYSDSPVGAFDELVVISGLVWNWPTSCAWAARVYVNDSSARAHGRKDVGLQSRLATFKTGSPLPHRKKLSWWQQQHPVQYEGILTHQARRLSRHRPAKHAAGAAASLRCSQPNSTSLLEQQQADEAVSSIVIRNAERRHWAQPWKRNEEQMQQPVCTLHLPDALQGWKGPRLKLALPSFRFCSVASNLNYVLLKFARVMLQQMQLNVYSVSACWHSEIGQDKPSSGNTSDQPGLLQYSCRLTTNIRPSKAAHIESTEADDSKHSEAVSHILSGKPVLALCFDNMEMKVQAPVPYKAKMPGQPEQQQLVPAV